MKTVEQQLAEALDSNKAQAKEILALKTQVSESNKEKASASLVSLCEAAKLAKPAADHLKKQFEGKETDEGMKEAVEAFSKTIQESLQVKKNNGADANARTAVEESSREELVKSIQRNFKVTREVAESMAE